jgi:hypothetical protein
VGAATGTLNEASLRHATLTLECDVSHPDAACAKRLGGYLIIARHLLRPIMVWLWSTIHQPRVSGLLQRRVFLVSEC